MLAVAILASSGDKKALDELHRNLHDEQWQVSTLRALRTVHIAELTDEIVEIVGSIGNHKFSDSVIYDGIVALGLVPSKSSQTQAAADSLLKSLRVLQEYPWYEAHSDPRP